MCMYEIVIGLNFYSATYKFLCAQKDSNVSKLWQFIESAAG